MKQDFNAMEDSVLKTAAAEVIQILILLLKSISVFL